MPSWRDVCISKDMSVSAAMAVIDAGAMRIALVTDGDGRLLGTLSDGDIRRALLKMLPMESKTADIMNAQPQFGTPGDSRAELLKRMNRNGIISLPIIDDAHKVVGIETLRSLSQEIRFDNPVFLMAGGFGTRLAPLTNECPKPMLQIGDKPILETILDNFIQAGFHRFYISTHYMPEMIQDHFGDGSDWDVSIDYIYEEDPLGTGGALSLLPEGMSDLPIIMMNGDILTKVDFPGLLKFHERQNATATVGSRRYTSRIPYGVMELDGNIINDIVEKPEHHYFVNAGIYVLDQNILQYIPQDGRMDMPDLLKAAISDKKTVSSFPIHEYWMDVGMMPDFKQAQKDYYKQF